MLFNLIKVVVIMSPLARSCGIICTEIWIVPRDQTPESQNLIYRFNDR